MGQWAFCKTSNGLVLILIHQINAILLLILYYFLYGPNAPRFLINQCLFAFRFGNCILIVLFSLKYRVR